MTTFLLIPGAGGEARFWDRLVAEVVALGHQAVAVELPSGDDAAGWSEYADATIEAARAAGATDPVVVAQSLGGFTAPIVAAWMPVRLLVLLNAMIPAPGETGNDWWANTGSGEAQRAYLATIGITPEEAEDDLLLYFHDVPPDVTEDAMAGETEQSMTPMTQPWPLEAWPDVPTRVLAGRDDRLFPATFQRRVARERLGLGDDAIDEIDGGHLVALSRPKELAARLAAYARA
jgi:pimeloyl-ACP methyl ester carboxylesterase